MKPSILYGKQRKPILSAMTTTTSTSLTRPIDLSGDADNQGIGLRKSLRTATKRCQIPLTTVIDDHWSLNANDTPLLERAHNLENVNLAETLLEGAIGVDLIIWVYGLGHLNSAPDDPSRMYDDWANVFILNDANYQRCARTAGQGRGPCHGFHVLDRRGPWSHTVLHRHLR